MLENFQTQKYVEHTPTHTHTYTLLDFVTSCSGGPEINSQLSEARE